MSRLSEATRDAVRAARSLALAALLLLTWSVAAAAQEGRSPTPAAPTTDDQIHGFFLMDQLESRFTRRGPDALQFNGFGWLGGDYNRIWLKPEGTKVYDGPWEDVDVQLLYGRLIAPFWDLQAGSGTSSPARPSPRASPPSSESRDSRRTGSTSRRPPSSATAARSRHAWNSSMRSC